MKKKILLIHTGGTIGMVKDKDSGVLKPDFFYNSISKMIPELSDIADIITEIPFVVDSSELNSEHWGKIADLIGKYVEVVDGVVITHGTDTLTYTASALSFMLQNLPIPVVLTGAQKPLSELRTDAKSNLINAIELATCGVNEVSIFFDDKLMRGNRSIKKHINHFDAFDSPNYPLLGKVGIDVEIYEKNVLKNNGIFHIFNKFDHSIAVFKTFPGCSTDYFIPDKDIRAILLITYGAGNIPLKNNDLYEKVLDWIDQGKIVALLSETKAGRVDTSLYESGNKLLEAGVVHSKDMTFEAVITKLMFLLGQYEDTDLIKKYFKKSLAGETYN